MEASASREPVLGDTGVRGFAYTFDLDAVQRLIAYDIDGAELAVIQTGA